jgi:beta-mannosidase
MLRVWGGGIYETDEFYDICDEMGMLVWQDFLFACATYPETEPIKSEVEAEARYNVARLAHHPSLVLWNGCNENIWGYHVWWDKDEKGEPKPWKDLVAGKGWGAGYYLDLLPKIVKELDGSRPYWAASPWSGDPDIENGLHPNLATHGNKHIWEVWHGKEGEYSNYRKFSPRFCSEFGYQGPPNYATLVAAIGKEGMKRGSKLLELHQKSPGAQEKNDRLLEKDFVIPVDNFDDWHYLLQLNQARALMAGVDWFRSRQPVCMGTLYWQLNDCYPVTSWSAIDSDGRLKPLWFATQQFYAPRRLTIQPNGAEYSIGAPLTLFAMNDTDEPWRESVVLQHVDFEKGAIEQTTRELRIDAAARSMCAIPISAALLSPKAPERQCLVCTARPGGERAMWFFLPDKQLDYPDARFTSDIKRNGDITVLNLRVGTLMRDVVLAPDRLDPDATPLSNLITMLPGEMAELKVRSSKDLPGEQLIRPPVLQCANRFGRTSA